MPKEPPRVLGRPIQSLEGMAGNTVIFAPPAAPRRRGAAAPATRTVARVSHLRTATGLTLTLTPPNGSHTHISHPGLPPSTRMRHREPVLEISLLSGLAKRFQQARLPLTRNVSARSRASGCPASAPPGLPASPSHRVAAAHTARRRAAPAAPPQDTTSADLCRVILVRHGPAPPGQMGLVVPR